MEQKTQTAAISIKKKKFKTESDSNTDDYAKTVLNFDIKQSRQLQQPPLQLDGSKSFFEKIYTQQNIPSSLTCDNIQQNLVITEENQLKIMNLLNVIHDFVPIGATLSKLCSKHTICNQVTVIDTNNKQTLKCHYDTNGIMYGHAFFWSKTYGDITLWLVNGIDTKTISDYNYLYTKDVSTI
jgi:hypothetical protein